MSNYFTNLANQVLKYANDNPRDFLFLVLVILTPFFLLSAFLSWKLSKQLEQDKKKKSKPKPKSDVKKSHSKGGRVKRE